MGKEPFDILTKVRCAVMIYTPKKDRKSCIFFRIANSWGWRSSVAEPQTLYQYWAQIQEREWRLLAPALPMCDACDYSTINLSNVGQSGCFMNLTWTCVYLTSTSSTMFTTRQRPEWLRGEFRLVNRSSNEGDNGYAWCLASLFIELTAILPAHWINPDGSMYYFVFSFSLFCCLNYHKVRHQPESHTTPGKTSSFSLAILIYTIMQAMLPPFS